MSGQGSSPNVRESLEQLRGEHHELHALIFRLEHATRAAEVVAVLDELGPWLQDHFAHEEFPGGLYDRMGATRTDLADAVRVLVDDHYRILMALRSTQASAAASKPEDLLLFAQEMVRWLREHERREHDLASRALNH